MVVAIDYNEGVFRVEEGGKGFQLRGTTKKKRLKKVARSIVGGKGPGFRWRYEALKGARATLLGLHS